MSRRRLAARAADGLLHAAGLAAALAGVSVLGALLAGVFLAGVGGLLRQAPAGLGSALAGSIAVVAMTGGIAIPIGIGGAVYLEEYAPRGRLARLVEINVANLAGAPPIVYGLLGLALFVRAPAFGPSLAAAAATLALLVLPRVILTTRDALRAVPPTLRDASYALGASRWRTIRHQVLPAALPSAAAGLVLALARALGEAAPLVVLGALAFSAAPPAALPVRIFDRISRAESGPFPEAAAGVVVLLALVMLVGGLAVRLRDRRRTAGAW